MPGDAPPRVYLGTFCTGHAPMVGTTAIQYAELSLKEFIEEYKNAHGMKHKAGPGKAKLYDPREQPPRPSPALPLAGSKLALLGTGQIPERQARTSSKAVGAFWNDPIFAQGAVLKDVVLAPGEKGPLPACMQSRELRTTSADVGQYWHDPIVEEHDPDMAKKRAQNGIRRLLPVEMNSQFALEDLPTQHRLL